VHSRRVKMKGATVLVVALLFCVTFADAGLDIWGWNPEKNTWVPDKHDCPAPSCDCPFNEGAELGGDVIRTVDVYTYFTPDEGCSEAQFCCAECKKTVGCKYWQVKRGHGSTGACERSTCELMSGCGNKGDYGVGYCRWLKNYMWLEWVKETYFSGALCETEIKNDPHFLGAQGTRYDFNGIPGKSFALISDEGLAVNMLLSGYYDTVRTEGATLSADGKGAIRSWIRELGIVWSSAEGIKHTLRMVARSGTEAGLKRGAGFLESMEVDGEVVKTVTKPGDKLESVAGITIEMLPYETRGPFDLDGYVLSIAGHMDFTVRLRSAMEELMLKDENGNVLDSEVHINLEIQDLKHTANIHGVLGQTYRADHHARALSYQEKVKELGVPIQADGLSGKGFLDGEMVDYEVDTVLSTNFKYSAFKDDSDISAVLEKGIAV
jgi:hypothetical protein